MAGSILGNRVARSEDPELLTRSDFQPLVEQVSTGLDLVEKALFKMDVADCGR